MIYTYIKKYRWRLLGFTLMILCVLAVCGHEPAAATEVSGSPTPTTAPTGTVTPATTGTPSGTVSPGATATPTVTPSPTPAPSTLGIGATYILYETEEIEVTATKPVYYAILKKDTDRAAKPADMIPAAFAGSNKYLIDFSNLSASKKCYIGIATSLVPNSSGMIDVVPLAIKQNQKKVVFNINWAAEGAAASGTGVFESIVVTDSDNKITTYKAVRSGADTELISSISIQWRKGANGEWSSISQLSSAKWASMRASGAIVYFRLGAKDQTASAAGQRYSKEAKIKLAVTKAPSAKVDVSRMTISFKNGMQFRIAGTEKWYTLLPYSAKSSVTKALRDKTKTKAFDPFTENTTEKVKYLLLDELYAVTDSDKSKDITLEYRIAATPKKSASRVSVLTIPAKTAAPSAAVVTEGEKYKVTKLDKAATDNTSGASFEFCIVNSADLTSAKIDYATLKWSSVKLNSTLMSTLKSTYTLTDKIRRTVKFTDTGAVMLIRRKGVSASKKKPLVLASDFCIIEISKISAATPTPAVTATPTPAATATPTPAAAK